MPVRVLFSCEVCGARPDVETQLWLERQLLDLRHGEYLDIEPQNWLVWHGRGLYGPIRYACGDHRRELKASIQASYGSLGSEPYAEGPHPWRFRKGTARARHILKGLPAPRGLPKGSADDAR